MTAALEQQDLVENVRISEERYGLWAEATNDGLWDWDLTTNTVFYSARCIELLGQGTASIIATLDSVGIGLQIDGIGAGASVVHVLQKFPIRALKIDRSFIHDLEVDARTIDLVQVVIDMGRALGCDVVAEGVDTEAQLALLREMGCRNAQGFLFTEAVDADTAAQLLGRSLADRSARRPRE